MRAGILNTETSILTSVKLLTQHTYKTFAKSTSEIDNIKVIGTLFVSPESAMSECSIFSANFAIVN